MQKEKRKKKFTAERTEYAELRLILNKYDILFFSATSAAKMCFG
jgi:hypothetical protein